MKNRIIIGLLLSVFTGSVYAQELAMPELQGYKKILNYPVYGPDKLWDFNNGAADVYLSYGFIDLHVAEYKRGKNIIKLEVYKHSDNIMAFGIYSSERSASFHFTDLGSQGYVIDGAINFFKGDYYVKIRTYSKDTKTLKAAESLAHNVDAMLPGGSGMPATLSAFPVELRKVNEETFINESVLGHRFLNKAFRANYQTGEDLFSVFILDKLSAEEVRKTVNEYLASAGMETIDSESGKYMFKDGYNGTIYLSWKDKRIVIISGLSKDQSDIADRYTSDILR
jgi:hypothetical protein